MYLEKEEDTWYFRGCNGGNTKVSRKKTRMRRQAEIYKMGDL